VPRTVGRGLQGGRGKERVNQVEDSQVPSHPKLVRVLLILVAITSILSLLYAIQYYVGGPIRLAVVSELYDVAFSPLESVIAAGAQDGRLRLWEMPRKLNTSVGADFDVAQEEPWPVRMLLGHKAPVIRVAFTPDGKTLFSVSSDGEVRRWEASTASGNPGQVVLQVGEPIVHAALSADRSLLAAMGLDGTIQVWNLASGQKVQSIAPTAGGGRAIALSDDGTLVAASDGVNIQVWEVESGAQVQPMVGYCDDDAYATVEACEQAEATWLGHIQEVTALAFSPDNQLLASGSADTTVLFWNVESGEVEWSSVGHWAAVNSLVFDKEGNLLLSTGADNAIKTLRVPGGKSTATFVGSLAAVNSGIFGPVADTLTTVSNDGTMRVWETGNQYVIHLEWSKYGFQPMWGKVLAVWLLVSGLLGLVCMLGLWQIRLWSHLLTLALFLVGPIVVLGLPFFEVLTYPLTAGVKLQVAWPLLILAAWYVALVVLLTREQVALFYEAPHAAALAEQLQVSQRTVKLRFGIYGLAVWIALLVLLFSVLRRFHLDVAFMGHFFNFIMQGSWTTLYISALSILLAVVLALFGALGRLSRNPIANGVSSFYISLIRGTPLLVQIFIWYLGLPQLGILLKAEVAGILALGVNYGAYMTEIFRAGIQAIGKGQHEAAQALGMSRSQTFVRIVLPQAFRIVIPPIGNEFIAMMKDSSLVYVMGVWELTFRANKIGRQNFRAMETFIIAAAFYWLLTVIFQFLQGKLEEYMARGERR
jgi:polar amino acid transport system permease protein